MQDEIRIMPLGDSITQANSENDSYRRPLWQKLKEAGFNNINFVGSLQENQGGPNPNPDFDLDHEGHWGWRTDEILNQLDGWVASAQPDVALIHLGTNDILQGQSADSTIDELGEVIDVFRANNPNIVIFLAQIIPAKRNDSEREELNQQIPILAAEKNQVDSPVIVVDQSSRFDLDNDTYDFVHPNSRGENKFANQWLASFNEVFNSNSSDILDGRQDNDFLEGGRSNDNLTGAEGDDTLVGGSDSDTLIGLRGNDALTGNGNVDTFVFDRGAGTDTITDFTDGTDLIGLKDDLVFGINVFQQNQNEIVFIENNDRETLAILDGFTGTLGAEDFVSI